MAKFTDSIVIQVRAGKGGPGSVSFRREKYVEFGGPDGGDGGAGGNVIIQAKRNFYNLSHLFKDKLYAARNGEGGMGRNRHGGDGEDLVINVPTGTEVIDDETGETIADLFEDDMSITVAVGGIGGKGNAFFKSSTFQTPRFAQPGEEGVERQIRLDLKLIADVGLVGLPNAGKSTILAALTNAHPKIADYPFTTLIPNLGVLQTPSGNVCRIADIPGIIEGAHMGHGLGLSFLQHIERVKVIVYVLDVSAEHPEYTHELLRRELAMYSEELNSRPAIVVLNKIDESIPEIIAEAKEHFGANYPVVAISALSGENIDQLVTTVEAIMEQRHAAH